MVRSMHVNRLLYGPLKLQLSRHQLHVESRNKLSVLYAHYILWWYDRVARVLFLSIQKLKHE